MSKKVCMFVWNHFTNDARVLRECTALVESGYEVDLIALLDDEKGELLKEEHHKNGFKVIRVHTKINLLNKISRTLNKMKKPFSMLTIAIIALLVTLMLFIQWKMMTNWYVITAYIGILLFIELVTLIATNPKLTLLVERAYIFLQMVRYGRKKRYDFYHSNDLNTLPQGVLSAKWLRRKKLIYDSHEVQTDRTGYNSPIFGILERFLLKFVNEMIAENHTRAKFNEQLYGLYPNVVHNYPIFSNPENSSEIDLKELLQLSNDEPILLYQGGIQTGRGLEKLIEAVPMFDKGTLVFIGDGKLKSQLVQMVKERHLETRVKFIPKVPVEELLHYTKNAYLGFQVLNNICFNHYSASSNKLFEYMMSGVPVIACSFPEIQKVVETEHIGICVDSHDPNSIAQGVNYLLNHPDVQEQMSLNCLQARNKYNWKREKDIFIEIYASA